MSASIALLICLLLAPPLGGALGALYGFRLGPPVIAFFFGGFVGILSAPLVAFALVRKRLLYGLPLIYLPSGAVAYATSGIPVPGLTILAFGLACLAAWIALPNVRSWQTSKDHCRACGYSLGGLPAMLCPECGTDNSKPLSTNNPDLRNPYERA